MKMQLVLKKKEEKKEKDEKMMKIEVARVYKSLKGLSSRNVNLQQLWRCIYVLPSQVTLGKSQMQTLLSVWASFIFIS